MNIHVYDDTAYVVAEGEPRSGMAGICFDIDGEWWHKPGSCPHCEVGPQPWMTAKCETCGGCGWTVEGQTYSDPYGEQIQCPDCIDGKPIHTFEVGCPIDLNREADALQSMLDRLNDGWYPSGRNSEGEHRPDRHLVIYMRNAIAAMRKASTGSYRLVVREVQGPINGRYVAICEVVR